MMFFKRRKQVPTARLISFIKRLNVMALQLEPSCSAVILHMLRKLINVKSKFRKFDKEDYLL